MCLLFGENVDEVVEISDTSASKKFEQLVVAVSWLYKVDNVFSLWPRDTSNSSKLSDKCMVWIDNVQQLNTVDVQCVHPS